MISTITLNGNTVNVVALPAYPGFAHYSLDMTDSVAIQRSPFTGQTQAQQWPGADMWTGTAELPALVSQADAQNWRAFLAQLRGMANAFQLAPPDYLGPQGDPLPGASSVPSIPGTVTDIAGAQILHTVGWQLSAFGLLQPGDWIQVGYRLHMVMNPVNSDSSGHAAIEVFPSLREAPTANAPLILDNPQGLFRLATNKRTWSTDYARVTSLSFQLMEYR